jgi:hypothetical protein
MKRFVYIPEGMITDGDIPQEALTLSAESQLSIREGFIGDGINVKDISVVSFPEINFIDSQEYCFVNFVHSIDVTNEFVSFDKNTFMEVITETGNREFFKPTLREKHVVKFRSRHSTIGKKSFCIYSDNVKICSGEFEVR